MRVAYNAMLLGSRRSGVENCILQLARTLAKLGTHDYVVYVPSDFKGEDFSSERLQVRRAAIPARFQPLRILWEQFVLPGKSQRDGADVLHAPGYIAPMASSLPVVATMYDLIALQYPRWCRVGNRLHYGAALPLSARKARRIIAPSMVTRMAIVDRLCVPERLVDVISPGIDDCFTPLGNSAADSEIVGKHRIPRPYILFVGNLEPKKNVGSLIEAFRRLKTAAGIAHSLVIAGRSGWNCSSLFRLVTKLDMRREVIFTGFIPAEELPAIYRCADLFVFPSWYEGFGLPPLEAMACGVPAIVSNRGALPETVGDAALTVDPADVPAITQAMRVVLDRRELRDSLVERGLERASRFAWRGAAAATDRTYEEARAGR